MATGTWQIVTDLEQAKELHVAGLLWCRRLSQEPREWFYLKPGRTPPCTDDYGVYVFGVKLED